MTPQRLLTVGLGMMIAGLVAIAVGVAVASRDLVVGLILLLLVPLSISFCGAVLGFIGVVRQLEAGMETRSRSAVIRRIIGGTALACLGAGFGFGALGTLSQLPDWFAGLNGAFRSESDLGFFAFAGMCLLTGLGLGILIALIWWVIRGRHLHPAVAAQSSR